MTKFRKILENSYKIDNERLLYKYYYDKSKYKWLYIPFENEVKPISQYLHNNNQHIKKEAMSKRIISLGFYWAGYTIIIDNFIKNCVICNVNQNIKKVPKKPKLFYQEVHISDTKLIYGILLII